jgi:hypothetical protein
LHPDILLNMALGTVAESPHAGAAEIQKPQGTPLCNSSGALPRLASPLFAPRVAGLWGNCWDHMTSVTSRATVHNAAFSACRIPAFIRETVCSAAPSSGVRAVSVEY